MHTKRFALSVLIVVLPFFSAAAGEAPVSVTGAWVRAVPPSSQATAAYFTIENKSKAAIRLVGGSCAIASKTVPMITTEQNIEGHDVMGMSMVPSLEIAAGKSLVLAPGGDHLMLMGLKSPPGEGSVVELTLRFEPGDQEVVVKAPVLREAPTK